ncbi:MAG: 4a-hydroxytetrahydrobiopterin dehydratase [Candidatus Marinimicrobia bacterium]|nr:4a-hydroxytetrahydrobiopterin dehydratase [Candidatus Neomarinimicrobiota bacterium]
MDKLSEEKIQTALKELLSWEFTKNLIQKEFTFDTYMAGIDFVNRIAAKAEEQNHHPDLEVGWCRVKVVFTSHDSGGVTERDIRMAKIVDGIVQ